MGTNPYQGQNPDQSNQYGGYTGYTPPSQDDPYSSQQYGGNTGGQQDYQYGQYTYGQQQQQQYGAYQPPQSAQRRGAGTGPSEADEATSLGMSGRTAAVASYVLFFLSGIVFFLLERKNRFVRFCAAQSTMFFGSVFIIYLFLRLVMLIPLLGFLLSPIIGCLIWLLLVASALTWVFLIIQAYRGVKVKLPFFGHYAENLAMRSSRR